MANQYLYLFRGGDTHLDGMSPEEMQAHMAQWGKWMGALEAEGLLVGGAPLERGEGAVLTPDKMVADGPYAEAKDLVGGYVMVTCATFETALQWAKSCPILDDNGTVEVRTVRKM